MKEFLKPIKIKFVYDERLKEITGKDFEEAVVSQNLTFIGLLNFLFFSYPEIPKKYPPGTLGFLLNNKPPREYSLLNDGDELKLVAAK